jgi:predicted HAD superfamily Cof-like phosphohydrolase
MGGFKNMNTILEKVTKFHDKYQLLYEGQARDLPKDMLDFRAKFMAEELEEYYSAETLTDRLDALCDLAYVLFGTVHLHGFGPIFDVAFQYVHEANLTKARVDDKRIPEEVRLSARHPDDIVKLPEFINPKGKISALLGENYSEQSGYTGAKSKRDNNSGGTGRKRKNKSS